MEQSEKAAVKQVSESPHRVILASSSPRRRELLGKVIKSYVSIAPEGKEHSDEKNPAKMAAELAERKAEEVAALNPGALVIGADTIVVSEGKVLGKPSNAEEAREMLLMLSGKEHTVYTGVCIVRGKDKNIFTAATGVRFRVLSVSEIEAYVRTGSSFDKAGGYGIQDCCFVTQVSGSYDNVVGLPTEELRICLDGMLSGKEKEEYGVL